MKSVEWNQRIPQLNIHHIYLLNHINKQLSYINIDNLMQFMIRYHQGNWFHATRGGHLCSDNMFITMELKKCRGETLLVETDKASRVAAEKVEEQALKILEGAKDDNEGRKKMKAEDIRVLLLFYGVERERSRQKQQLE